MNCFSIYDKKTAEYMTPFFVPNVVTALRSIQQALTKEASNLASYPHDFALYELGNFNKDEGLIVSNGNPKFVEEIANLMPQKS